jgi:hypothetical protein
MVGRVGYYPRSWREATMVIIPKPNKLDYSSIKAYCPIVLLNCLGKVMETIMATCLRQLVEMHDILHIDQIGGHPKRSAIDIAMALTHDVETHA